MSIRFFDGVAKPEKMVRFATYPPMLTVRLLGAPVDCVKVWLHMVGGLSVPCQGSDCAHCENEAFPFGYAPVCVGVVSGQRFIPSFPAILPVTSQGLDLCLLDLRRYCIQVWRTPANKYGTTSWQAIEEREPINMPCFDLLSRLMSVWRKREHKLVREISGKELKTIERDGQCGQPVEHTGAD